MQTSPRRALMWSLFERYANFALTLGSTVVLARLLTPAEVGVYSVCAAFVTMAALLRDFGVSEYLIQERELTRMKIRSAMGIALVTAWTLGAAMYAARVPLARWLGEPGVARVLGVTTLQFLILPLSSPAFALMNRELAFRQIFFLHSACNVAHACTALLLAWHGFGYMSLAWAPVASVSLQAAILGWLRPRDTFVRPTLREARPVLRFGVTYMASRTVDNLAQNVHEPVVAKVFGFAALGLYSRAFGMVEMLRNYVADAVTRVATPAFALEHRDGRAVAPALLRAATLYSALAWPFCAFVALAARELLRLLFGAQWVGAAPLATVLALAALPAGLYEFVPQMLSATGHVQRRLRISLVVGTVQIGAVLLGASFGLAWVAAASFASGLTMLALCAWQLRRALDLPALALLRAGRGSAALALACALAQGLALAAARQAQLGAPLVLACTFAAGAVAWVIAARALHHPAWHEVAQLAQRLRRRPRLAP